MEKSSEFNQTVGNSESTSHPFESGVVVAIGVNRGCPIEDMKVIDGEARMVMELGFEEVEKAVGCERRSKMGLNEVKEVMIVGIGRES